MEDWQAILAPLTKALSWSASALMGLTSLPVGVAIAGLAFPVVIGLLFRRLLGAVTALLLTILSVFIAVVPDMIGPALAVASYSGSVLTLLIHPNCDFERRM